MVGACVCACVFNSDSNGDAIYNKSIVYRRVSGNKEEEDDDDDDDEEV